jgi:hypothetical protein
MVAVSGYRFRVNEKRSLTVWIDQRLHRMCILGWGMPLGELFDLGGLARIAEKNKRWSFFLTVSPLNLQGGANTLSNTVAIF